MKEHSAPDFLPLYFVYCLRHILWYCLWYILRYCMRYILQYSLRYIPDLYLLTCTEGMQYTPCQLYLHAVHTMPAAVV